MTASRDLIEKNSDHSEYSLSEQFESLSLTKSLQKSTRDFKTIRDKSSLQTQIEICLRKSFSHCEDHSLSLKEARETNNQTNTDKNIDRNSEENSCSKIRNNIFSKKSARNNISSDFRLIITEMFSSDFIEDIIETLIFSLNH